MTENFTRSPEDLEFRKQRADAYKKLVKDNDDAWKRYSKKSGDDFDDLLGGAFDDGPKINTKGMSANDIMRATKSCYQRLASINRENKDQIIQQIKTVKLTKFLEESVSNLMSAKLTMVDIPAFVEVVSILHQFYKEFVPMIAPRIIKECESSEDTPRRRIYVCVLIDLLIVHVLRSATPLVGILNNAIQTDVSAEQYNNFQFLWGLIKYAGGDMFGVSRGENTIIDPIFPQSPVSPLKKEIFGYFKSLLDSMNKKMEEGRANFEKAYELIVRFGSINSGDMQEAKENRREYDELREMAQCLGFLVNKEVPDMWVDTEEMSELSTIDGIIKVPARLLKEAREQKQASVSVSVPNVDNFYDILADMEVNLVEPLGFDIHQVRIEVDRATDSSRIDTLARHYHLIDNEEIRPILIQLFSNINKNKGNQAKYLARFVADVNQVFPEVGPAIMKNLCEDYRRYIIAAASPKINAAVKLHLARYIAELAHFKIGIEDYFDCISITLQYFRPRTAEMLCTLLNISGKFFDKYCDQTHTNIRSVLEEMGRRKPEIATHQYAVNMVEQTINSIDPPEQESTPVFYANSYNEYQAFITYFFKSEIDKNEFPKRATRYIEKLMNNYETTHVDMKFVLKLVLDLNAFSAAQLGGLAKFVFNFSKVYPIFGMQVADIVCERVRRFLECPNTNYKQRLLMESRFLAELCVAKVVSFEDCYNFANFILSFNSPPPSHMLIKIERPGKQSVKSANRDFRRIFVVARMIETLLPMFGDTRYQQQLIKLVTHMQIYTICRTPIPANVAFRISEILDTLKDLKIPRIESTADAKLIREDPRTDYELHCLRKPIQIVKNRLEIVAEPSTDSEEEDNADELYEASFNREKNEFMDLLEQTSKAKPSPHDKINIPIDLLAQNAQYFPKFSSKQGPSGPIDFYTSNNKFITINPADIMK